MGGEPEQERCYNSAEELSYPVVNCTEKGDSAADKCSKGDSRVDMATGAVNCSGNCCKEPQGVSYGNHHKTRCRCCPLVHLFCMHRTCNMNISLNYSQKCLI